MACKALSGFVGAVALTSFQIPVKGSGRVLHYPQVRGDFRSAALGQPGALLTGQLRTAHPGRPQLLLSGVFPPAPRPTSFASGLNLLTWTIHTSLLHSPRGIITHFFRLGKTHSVVNRQK